MLNSYIKHTEITISTTFLFSLFMDYFNYCICFLMDHDDSVCWITSAVEVGLH